MPNINNSIIDFNDFNAEPQLLRDIQDGKAIAFYSFAHLLLNADGTPYTMSKGVQLSGNYDTLSALKAAFPNGNSNLYIVNEDSKIYYWNGADWVVGGEINVTYASTLELDSPSESTSGTLTSTQLNTLNSNTFTQIKLGNFIYRKEAVINNEAIYRCITNDSLYVISVNTNTGSWVKTTQELPEQVWTIDDIPNGAITPNKLSFVKKGNNLFNKDSSDIILGKYLAVETGVVHNNADYFISEYIPVEPNTVYVSNIEIFNWVFYNSQKEMVQTEYQVHKITSTSPSNASYLRITTLQSNMPSIMICANSVPDEYVPYMLEIDRTKIGVPISVNDLKNNSITPKKTTFIETIENLIDPNAIQENKYWLDSFQQTTGSDVSASPLIELKPNTHYFIDQSQLYGNGSMFTYLYNKEKTSFVQLQSVSEFTTDETHVLIAISWKTKSTLKNPYLQETMEYGILEYGDSKLKLTNQAKDTSKDIYVGATREIKSIREAMTLANKINDVVVHIDSGTYDLTQDFQDIINTTEFPYDAYGLQLKNNVRVIGEGPDVVIKFHYTGDKEWIKKSFSPFNTREYGGTLENITIECSNCRYCVHDERGDSKDYYHNRFINCRFFIDNSQNLPWDFQNICIGGGLGMHGLIEIDKCLFSNISYYHENGNANDSKNSFSRLYLTNCYFIRGNFYVSDVFPNNPPTTKSIYYGCNNSFEQNPNPSDIKSWTSYTWNNEVRGV